MSCSWISTNKLSPLYREDLRTGTQTASILSLYIVGFWVCSNCLQDLQPDFAQWFSIVSVNWFQIWLRLCPSLNEFFCYKDRQQDFCVDLVDHFKESSHWIDNYANVSPVILESCLARPSLHSQKQVKPDFISKVKSKKDREIFA